MPGVRAYNIKTMHSDVPLLACIATHVWDMDPEMKCTYNFAAKIL